MTWREDKSDDNLSSHVRAVVVALLKLSPNGGQAFSSDEVDSRRKRERYMETLSTMERSSIDDC